VIGLADSGQDRTRRWRAHNRGDHRHCAPSRCPYAGKIERADVAGLRQAVEAEFRDDPVRLEVARRHVEQAAEKGQSGVAAVVAIDKMIEARRAGRSAPVGGPVTIDDEIIALANKLIGSELLGRVDALEAACAELGGGARVAAGRAGGLQGRARRVGSAVTGSRRWGEAPRPPGQQPLDPRVVAAIHELAAEHPDWGSRRIAREVGSSRRSVQRYLGAARSHVASYGPDRPPVGVMGRGGVPGPQSRAAVAWAKAAATAMTEEDHERFEAYRGAVVESPGVWSAPTPRVCWG
jgi:hypothetical protein